MNVNHGWMKGALRRARWEAFGLLEMCHQRAGLAKGLIREAQFSPAAPPPLPDSPSDCSPTRALSLPASTGYGLMGSSNSVPVNLRNGELR